MKGRLLGLMCGMILAAEGAVAAPQWAFRVRFTDKAGSPALSAPAAFLTTRALQRRSQQGIAVTDEDRPVSPTHVADALTATGGKLHVTSRWFNQVVLLLDDSSRILQLQGKSYVTGIEYVGYIPSALHNVRPGNPGGGVIAQPGVMRGTGTAAYYGLAWDQTNMVHGDALHDQGLRGSGQLIAVLDFGFTGVNTHPGFDSLRQQGRIVDAYNFVNANTDIYSSGWDHGTSTLSTMAGIAPGSFVGAAPDAQYALYLTDANDNAYNDAHFDLDGFVAGLERADSIGADIITSSLGYNYFNNPTIDTFTKAQLNGRTTLVARAANIATTKGIFVVASAGNEGGGSWNYLLTPGDADSALTVGAVNSVRATAGFSSPGPSLGGRIKPDVMLQGAPAAVFSGGGYGYANGTSFSTPQLAGWAACVRQLRPDVPPYVLRAAIQRSGDRAGSPTAKEGYGIPDFGKVLAGVGIEQVVSAASEVQVAPNPFTHSIQLQVSSKSSTPVRCTLTDANGRTVAGTVLNVAAGNGRYTMDVPASLPAGIYFLQTMIGQKVLINRLTKL